ncbi:MAG: hypothetical protein ACE5DM_04955 [Candidatus Nanoarchaeia archaeon]
MKKDIKNYDELNKEYEIGLLEDDEFLSRNIRKKIAEKIEYIVNNILPIIQPENDIANLHEVSFFEDKERQELVELYKKLMYYYRYSCRLNLEDSDKENENFIQEAHSGLKNLKPSLKNYFDKLKDTWKKDSKKLDDAGYFG